MIEQFTHELSVNLICALAGAQAVNYSVTSANNVDLELDQIVPDCFIQEAHVYDGDEQRVNQESLALQGVNQNFLEILKPISFPHCITGLIKHDGFPQFQMDDFLHVI